MDESTEVGHGAMGGKHDTASVSDLVQKGKDFIDIGFEIMVVRNVAQRGKDFVRDQITIV